MSRIKCEAILEAIRSYLHLKQICHLTPATLLLLTRLPHAQTPLAANVSHYKEN